MNRWQISTEEDAPHRISAGNCKWRPETTSQNSQIQARTPPNAGENVEQQEVSLVAGGNTKQCTHLEESMEGSYKRKHTLTV